MTATAIGSASFRPATRRNWIALHVFYASSSDPMLVECVAPLVDELRRDGLVQRYFFIRYWQEGPHVRLRLLPAEGVDPATVRARAERALDEFLRRRPALYEVDQIGTAGLYRQLHVAEYGEASWDETYGPDGAMPFRANNSHHHFAYEPEYERYGGPHGIEVSEWHFERSSDEVLNLLATANVHVRPVMLGLSVQLSAIMCYVFLTEDRAVADFLGRYGAYWEESYQGTDTTSWHPRYDRSYERMAVPLRERLARIRMAVCGTQPDPLTPFERNWIEHCRDLRGQVSTLAEAGLLHTRRDRSGTGQTSPREPVQALRYLLSSYTHMTNNRLGVSMLDEAYLSYVVRLAIHDELGARAGER
jgi:hypothetical protein